MFRIRRIFDDVHPVDRHALKQVAAILRLQFELLDRRKIDRIPELLRLPLKYGVRSILYIAEDHRSQVRGLALLDHDADLKFCYLDYLVSDKRLAGRGVGGALYHRVRSEALSLGVNGIFFECLPDDPNLCHDPEVLKQNRARLKFYEAYDARPLMNTAYETPIRSGSDNPPYLVFDDLAQGSQLSKRYVKDVIACILERKYKDICGPDYVRMVLDSVHDDPVRLRPPRYTASSFLEKRNAATAAHYFSKFGKVAILDIDYHHGNGQQYIFYSDVLTISIHGHPSFAYPYFSGFADERGEGEGKGYNVNYPLPETIDAADYIRTLRSALTRVREFGAKYFVVCLGLDTAKGDPTGTWNLKGRDFTAIGREIGQLKRPCLVIQEGGYNNRSIGANARSFFYGLQS